MKYLGLEMRMFILLEISIRQQFLNAATKITKIAQNVGVIQPWLLTVKSETFFFLFIDFKPSRKAAVQHFE